MILNQLRAELKQNIDQEFKAGAENFFKEKIVIYGVRSAKVKALAQKYFPKDLELKEVLKLAEQLLQSGYMEEITIGLNWAQRLRPKFQKTDFKIFETWLKKYISNWANCDDLASHLLGFFIFKWPQLRPRLKSWVFSSNRWLKRGAAVSLLYPVKQSQEKCLKDVFWLTERLLLDKDDLVQKGYGWLLKEAAAQWPEPVFEYVYSKKEQMPRTAFRYALEKMAPDLKKKAMAK